MNSKLDTRFLRAERSKKVLAIFEVIIIPGVGRFKNSETSYSDCKMIGMLMMLKLEVCSIPRNGIVRTLTLQSKPTQRSTFIRLDPNSVSFVRFQANVHVIKQPKGVHNGSYVDRPLSPNENLYIHPKDPASC